MSVAAPSKNGDGLSVEAAALSANGRNRNLDPHHWAELQDSGISAELAAAAGIYSEHRHDRMAMMLNRKTFSRKHGAAIVFPFHDAEGVEVFKRIKPDNPAKRDGKPVKYLQPSGQAVRPYFPPGVREQLETLTQEVIITEGEKKSLCGTQHGFPTIGLTGVEGWHKKRSTALSPDLAAISWKRRPTFIIFDSDSASNPNVRDAECQAGAAFAREGADVKVVRLPAGPNGEKVGLDDFLVAYGTGALRKLMDEAEPPERPAPEELRDDAVKMDPATTVETFLDSGKADDLHRLRFWRGGFLLWEHGAYREVSLSEVRADMLSWLNGRYSRIATFHVANCLDQVKAQTILPGRIESPTWIESPKQDYAVGWKPKELLSTRGEIVNLQSLAAGEPHAIPATPRFFTPVALGCRFNLDAPSPLAWLHFLDELWGDDQGSIELLQEWFGYCLVTDTSQQKIMLLIGPPRSGKGTIARVQREVVGRLNVAGPTLASLATNFGLWPLVGKSVAIVSDARLGGRTDAAVVVERLLSISGEDTLTIDRKFQEPITVKLPTRFTIISNELPRLSDSSGALSSRMLMLRVTKSFLGKEDPGLTDRLLSELPGILLWAVQGWQRLNQRRYFLQSESGKELLGELEDLTSPINAFIRECCEIASEASVSRESLYAAYLAWCTRNGRKHAEDRAGFGRALRAAVPELGSTYRRHEGKRQYHHEGIGLAIDPDF